MRIKALSVFEGVVYHCHCVDPSNPANPTLEVEAVLREGDTDGGPILLPLADFVFMIGEDTARRVYPELEAAGRIVEHLGIKHVSFPMWTAGDITLR